MAALSAPAGRPPTRAYCILSGNRLKMWWGSDVRDEGADPPNQEVLLHGKSEPYTSQYMCIFICI